MYRRGFTLIELLVVIAIIGILSSVVLASLNSVRGKGRDAKRVSDLRQIQSALELYWLDNNAYPTGGAGSDRGCWVNQDPGGSCHPLGYLVDGGYISSIPYDPGENTYLGGTGCDAAEFYAYWSNGSTYLLGAVQEGSSGSCTQNGNWSGPTATNYTYEFYVRSGT